MVPYISVVVPVYNTSKYLRQCIDSLIHQTLNNIELIFVDDGSTDDSLSVLKEYAARDSRIMILEQKNQYAGVARNNGMKHASGKYIIFLDSDDFFELNMLEELYITAERNNVDIVLFGFFGYDNLTGTTEYTQMPEIQKGVFSPKDLGKDIFSVCDGVTWNKLYLKKFVEETGLTFQPLIHSNDAFFTRMIVVLATRMIYIKKRFVHYRYNNSNSLQGKRDRNILCFGEAFLSIRKELERRNLFTDEIKEAYNNNMLDLIEVRFETVHLKSNIKLLYEYFKKMLIPYFFDSMMDFPEDHMAMRIYESKDFEDFMEGEYIRHRNRMTNLVTKEAIEYRIGREILRIPRKIRRFFKR